MKSYKVGDKVEVIRGPGSITVDVVTGETGVIFHSEDESIGQQGIIREAHKTQGIDNYALHYPNGFGGKQAWFNNKDLKLV